MPRTPAPGRLAVAAADKRARASEQPYHKFLLLFGHFACRIKRRAEQISHSCDSFFIIKKKKRLSTSDPVSLRIIVAKGQSPAVMVFLFDRFSYRYDVVIGGRVTHITRAL